MGVTLKQIARSAGVSTAAVSHVLHQSRGTRVAAGTRDRIEKIAADLGYRVNPHARAMVTGKAPLIVVAARQTTDTMHNAKAFALMDALGVLDRDVVGSDAGKVRCPDEAVDILLANSPEAVVMLSPTWEAGELHALCSQINKRGVHAVVVDGAYPLDPETPCDHVAVDREKGIYLATSHLLDLAHRSIGLLTRPQSVGRLCGYEHAMQDRGIDARFVEFLDPELPVKDAAGPAALALLERHPEITALVCGSDITSLAAMHALSGRGLAVPRDLSVVGFDNEQWTAYLAVPLTTVAQPNKAIAATVVRLLKQRFSGNASKWQRIALPPELVVRETTRPL